MLACFRVGSEVNSRGTLTDTPSVEGNLAISVETRKARTLLGIYSVDPFKHSKYLMYKVLQYSFYLQTLEFCLFVVKLQVFFIYSGY